MVMGTDISMVGTSRAALSESKKHSTSKSSRRVLDNNSMTFYKLMSTLRLCKRNLMSYPWKNCLSKTGEVDLSFRDLTWNIS